MVQCMVSVLVTFYNQIQYMDDTLNSIFNQQTEFEFEVLCGDDGSTDGTYEELLRWQEKLPEKCTVWQMSREHGKKYEPIVRVSNNRVTLLKHAKGKYVIFLDGDDYYTDSHKLQKQVDLLEKHPDCVACGHPVIMTWDDEPNRVKVRGRISNFSVKISNKLYWSHLWFHADTILFRNVYKGNVEQINNDFFDDNLITCYFIKYGNMLYIPDCMVAYRQIPGSSWNKRTELQKAVVNMRVYHEAKKVVPEMKWQSFMKCHSAWERFYENRKTDIASKCAVEFVYSEKVVKDTLRYYKSDSIYRLFYELKYYIPMRMGVVFRILKKIHKIGYKKI